LKVRKSYLFAAAGAAVFLCGCPTTKITGNKTVIPAPMEDPVSVTPAVATAPGAAEWQAPEIKKEEKTVAQPEFQPLTGVTSSGGIESTGAKSSKKAVKGGKAATAGGVYVVQSGDTPERIARKLRIRLSALMAANNLDQQSARRLQIGQKLTIPGSNYKVAPKKSAKVKKSTATATPATVDSEGKYTVQSGDTPERIARKHRVRLSELLKANNLDQQSARRLQIGQKLVIPGKAAAPKSEDVVPPIPYVENKSGDQVVTDTQVPVTGTADVKVKNTETVTNTTTGTTVQSTTAIDAVDTDSDDQVIEITEATTAAELAQKYNVSADVISQKNSGKTEFPKGELIFVPKK